MSTQGVILIDLMALGFIILILNFVRKHTLNIGHALIWIIAVVGMMTLVTFTPLRDFITRAVGAIYPASALTLLAFVFFFIVLIYFSVQLSIMSTRQIELIQTIAVLELKVQEVKSQTADMTQITDPAQP
jgi:Uncharacterized conserved protein (DUF2304)